MVKNRIGNLVFRSITDLKPSHNNLKTLSKSGYQQLCLSFLRHGIISPLYIWNDYILDGHQRVKTLLRMQGDGVETPDEVPCIEIKAENRREAKRFLLQYISLHGKDTASGLENFQHS